MQSTPSSADSSISAEEKQEKAPPPPASPPSGKPSAGPVASGAEKGQKKHFSVSFKNIILGLCIAVVALVLVYAGYKFFGEAWSGPQDVRVTNVTSRSVTVSWVTEEKTKGAVIYAEEDSFLPSILAKVGKEMSLDDRDVSKAMLETIDQVAEDSSGEVSLNGDLMAYVESGSYYTHHVTIKNLDPEKTYYFRVGNGVRFSASSDALVEADDMYTVNEDYSFTTYAETDDLFVPNPSYGSVNSNGDAVSDGILYMVIAYDGGTETSAPVSATLNDEGNWYVDLSNVRTLEGGLIDSFSESEDFEIVYVNAGGLGESERTSTRMDNDAPMPAIEVTSSSSDAGSAGTEESRSPFVSYVSANYSQCVSFKTGKKCDDTGCCGCNYTDEGVQQECGYMEYCCDDDGGEEPEEPEPEPTSSGCPDGASPSDCNALNTGCHSQAGVQGNCQWVPNGCSGGHFVNNACPGSEKVKCCIPEATIDPNAPDPTSYMCAQPNAPDECFVGDACGNNGKCQNFAYGKTDCTVNGKAGKYSSNLCGGGIQVRCCEPTSQESAAGPTQCEQAKDGVMQRQGCGAQCASDPDGCECVNLSTGEYCQSEQKNVDCGDHCPAGTESSDLPQCGSGKHCVTATTAGGQEICNSLDGASLCTSGNEGVVHCCCDSGDTCFDNLGSETPGPEVTPAGPTYQCQCRKTADSAWEEVSSPGVTCFNLGLEEEWSTCRDKPEDVPVQRCASFHVKDCDGENKICDTAHYDDVIVCGGIEYQCKDGLLNACVWDSHGRVSGCVDKHEKDCYGVTKVCNSDNIGDVINCDGIEYECAKGLLNACVWDSHGRTEGCTGSDHRDCDGTDEFCNSSTYGDEIVCSKKKYLCDNQSNVFTKCEWKDQGKVDDLWCQCINNVKTTIENVPAGEYESCEELEENVNKYDGCEELTYAPQRKNDAFSFISPAYAEDVTYVVTDDYIFEPGADGVYTIIFPGGEFTDEVVLREGSTYQFFLDGNGNGSKDDDEDYIGLDGLELDITVDDTLSVFSLSLQPGLNYVSFPSLPSEADSCELITSLNGLGEKAEVTMLARFESGAYNVTSYRADAGGEISGGCFPVVPGRGYVIRSYVYKDVALGGFPLSEPAQVGLDSPGWHLIGVNAATESYTALSLIDSMNQLESVTVDNVTQWDHDSSRYEGLQKENEEVYGFDFPIEDKIGYFVRVAEGSGVWTPDMVDRSISD